MSRKRNKIIQRREQLDALKLKRSEPTKKESDRVLIVCEGAKTEPAYFRRLREVYRLSSANIYVTPANGSDPDSVVAFAEEQLEKNYDRIYCVFDRDNHLHLWSLAGNSPTCAGPGPENLEPPSHRIPAL